MLSGNFTILIVEGKRLRFFKEYRQKKEFRRDFLSFFFEAQSNLEQYYVMFQLGRLRFFSLEA